MKCPKCGNECKKGFIEMGNAARDYYNNYRTVKHMVSGFVDAVNYACSDNGKSGKK